MRYAVAVFLLVLAACGGGGRDGGPVTLGPNGLQTVASAIRIGNPPGTYANDLDGDGHADDQLGVVAASLGSGTGTDLQGDIDASITDGDVLLLLEIRSNDPAFASDREAAVVMHIANAQASPDFSGQGTFSIDTSIPAVTMAGKIESGIFTSTPQSGKPEPLALPLSTGTGVVSLSVIDVQLRATVDAEAHALTNGRLTGAILGTDIATKLVPTITEGLNPIAAAIIASAFRSDVALLDGDGKLAPSATRTPKDAFSLGLGLSAVGATY